MIRSSDLEQAHELIEFNNGFGTWRKSKENDIILQSKTIQQIENYEFKIDHFARYKREFPIEYQSIDNVANRD